MRYLRVLALLIALVPSSAALASITVSNQAGQHIYWAHFMTRNDSPIWCSWSAYCGGGHKQVGWWGIYPGNWAVVSGVGWTTLAQYAGLAEGTTKVWYGNDPWARKCVPWTAHDRCNPRTSNCPAGERLLNYIWIRPNNAQVCGGAADHTLIVQ